MCLHYLVKLIARVLWPHVTYFSIPAVDCWHQIFINCETTVSTVNNCCCRVYWYGESCRRGSTTRGKLQLRQRIVEEWERLDQRIIDGAVNDWRKRLRACAAAEGGQLVHELWLLVQQCCCNYAWLCRLTVWLLITFDVTVFSVLWLFQSHAAVVKRYNITHFV